LKTTTTLKYFKYGEIFVNKKIHNHRIGSHMKNMREKWIPLF